MEGEGATGGVALLTRVLPGGGGDRKLGGEPLAVGVSQLLLGALQCALGAGLFVALQHPVGAELGAPIGAGAVLMVSGAVLVAMAQRPSVGLARAALALGVVASIGSFLALGLQGLLLPHTCPTCYNLGPSHEGALLGAHALLMTSAAAGAALAVTGSVAAARGRPKAGGGAARCDLPDVTSCVGGRGLSEATPHPPFWLRPSIKVYGRYRVFPAPGRSAP
ncbi:uncharacterized protein LOC133263370 [Pezoporus flaviventris]|uniref:uncharacterized protein LOC133263370 n=1 Tax=Pezoporus flaviventris TaxID=889875 RepID=UPI002AB10981|nr:uncharacterized protein LOC133263370 [Pezoporus flaviventris]